MKETSGLQITNVQVLIQFRKRRAPIIPSGGGRYHQKVPVVCLLVGMHLWGYPQIQDGIRVASVLTVSLDNFSIENFVFLWRLIVAARFYSSWGARGLTWANVDKTFHWSVSVLMQKTSQVRWYYLFFQKYTAWVMRPEWTDSLKQRKF